jgi:hypothetical protein
MLLLFSITCISMIIIESYGNPVINNTNVDNSESQIRLSCEQNALSKINSSLFEVNLKKGDCENDLICKFSY